MLDWRMTSVVEEDGGQQFIDWKSGDVQREEKLVATALVGKQPMSFAALVLSSSPFAISSQFTFSSSPTSVSCCQIDNFPLHLKTHDRHLFEPPSTSSGRFWPTGLPSFAAALHPRLTSVNLFKHSSTLTADCGDIKTFCCVGSMAHRIDGIELAAFDVHGHETYISQVSWFSPRKPFCSWKFLKLRFLPFPRLLPPRKKTIRSLALLADPIIKLFANFVNFTKFTGPFLGLPGQVGSGRNGQSEKFIGH